MIKTIKTDIMNQSITFCGMLLIMFFFSLINDAKAQKLAEKVVLEENFDSGKTLKEMGWEPRTASDYPESTIPQISTQQKVSGTYSLYFNGKGGIANKIFDKSNEGLENLVVEWKVKVLGNPNFMTVGLYGKKDLLLRIALNSGNLQYYSDAKTRITLTPYTTGEWLNFRVVLMNDRYNLYMNEALVGKDLPTAEGNTKATRIYCSMGADAEAFIDDVRVSYFSK